MNIWTVCATRANESLDCQVFETEQAGLEGYLDAMGVPREERDLWHHLIRLYWEQIDSFDEWVEGYIEANYPGDMYRLTQHNINVGDEHPLYNEQGEQIREVTQREIDWTH